MPRFLASLICRLSDHAPHPEARRDDSRKLWVVFCRRCGAEIDFTLPCPEYPDESMGNCGDVQCNRLPSDGPDDVCEDVTACRVAWCEAKARFEVRASPGTTGGGR